MTKWNYNRKAFYAKAPVMTGVVLFGLLLLMTTLLLPSASAQTRVRKEFRTMTATEWNSFVTAVKILNVRFVPIYTTYDKYVKIQMDHFDDTQDTALYFPFHRKLLLEFENELRKISPNVTLPYWDWSWDSQAPAASLIFQPTYLGGNGSGVDWVVRDGRFANWTVYYPGPHFLQRRFNDGARIWPLSSRDIIQRILSSSRALEELRQSLVYTPIGRVHVGIGGDMATKAAPNDPIYWLHMAFVDKLWNDWQQQRPGNLTNVSGNLADGSRATATTNIPYFNVPISSVLNTGRLQYSYGPPPLSPPLSPTPTPRPSLPPPPPPPIRN